MSFAQLRGPEANTANMKNCLLVLLLAQGLFAQDSPYAGLSDSAAKIKFERTTVEQRMKQRTALSAAHDQLKQLADQNEIDQASRQALHRLQDHLEKSSDLSAALEMLLQERRALNQSLLPNYETIVGDLSQRWHEYQECKLEYQRALGQSLAHRWPGLSIEEKRSVLGDYLALGNERPSWLLRNTTVDIKTLFPKSVMPPIDQYQGEKADLIQRARTELQPALDAIIKPSKQLANDNNQTARQRAEAAGIAEILEAPYGQGLSGILLCLPNQELPTDLRLAVEALLKATIKKIDQLQPSHIRLLNDLTARMESSQSARLNQGKFAEQMAIDIYLSGVTKLVEPMRVLANRTPASGFFESAKLLEVQSVGDRFRYRVQFLIDGAIQWLEMKQIITRSTQNLTGRMQIHVPVNGPGKVITNNTDLQVGQVYAYSPAGWKPAIVVGESALGVAIRWQGSVESIEFTFPRHELRIVGE